MKKLIEIFGWYGMAAVVGAYALISFSLVQSGSLFYQILNFTGAVGVSVISVRKRAYQPATLNIIWAVIALVAIVKLII